MTVRLHIERLVVDPEFGLARADTQVLRDAVMTELGSLLRGVETAWGSADRLAIVTQATFAAGPPGALGTQIAETLHGCLRRPTGDPIS